MRDKWGRNLAALMVLVLVLLAGGLVIRFLLKDTEQQFKPAQTRTSVSLVPTTTETPDDDAGKRLPNARPGEIALNLLPPEAAPDSGILRRWPNQSAVEYLHDTRPVLEGLVGRYKDEQALQGITVYLDARGGGSSQGAVYPHAVGDPEAMEKTITLEVAKLAARELEALGARVILTRQGDDEIGLYRRSAAVGKDILTDYLQTAEARGLHSERLSSLLPELDAIIERNVDKGGGGILSGDTTTTQAKLLYDVEAQYDDRLLISLQVNNWPDDETVHGTQAYYLTSARDYTLSNAAVEANESVKDPVVVDPVYRFRDDRQRERLAKLLRSAMHDHLPASAAESYRQDLDQLRYSVLRHNNLTNAVLSLGYISNPEDREMMTNPESQQTIGAAIADAVFRYYSEHPDPSPPELRDSP